MNLKYPLPFYYGFLWWIFKGRFGCHCRRGFWRMASYERHFEQAHLDSQGLDAMIEHGENCTCDKCVFPPIDETETLNSLTQEAREINETLPDYEPGVDALKRWLS